VVVDIFNWPACTMNGHGRFAAYEINASSQDQQSEPLFWIFCSSTAT
jgi:hypothetical protein